MKDIEWPFPKKPTLAGVGFFDFHRLAGKNTKRHEA
jgi:hypothetical protein